MYSILSAQTPHQIRIYGMRFFNETEEYWGDKVKPLIGAGNGRLHSRSVKMFGDGMSMVEFAHILLIAS